MSTNGEELDKDMGGSDIRYMTYILLWDAPDKVFGRWAESLYGPTEFDMRQSTWRIILQVEASGVGR